MTQITDRLSEGNQTNDLQDGFAVGLEQDPTYLELQAQIQKQWETHHPESPKFSAGWQDFMMGDTTNPQAQTISSAARARYRELYPERFIQYKTIESKRIYQDLNSDPLVRTFEEASTVQANRNFGDYREPEKTLERLSSLGVAARMQQWDAFCILYPEKAAAYAAGHEGIRAALERIGNKNK